MRLYLRRDCSLCETMQRELVAAGYADIDTIDIDSSESLLRRFGHKVPVLTDTLDHEICHYFLDRDALDSYFATH